MKAEHQEVQNMPRRNYARISFKKKASLIKLVFRKRLSVDQAIIQLGLKKTTAINIISKYKELGTFPMRKYKQKYLVDEKQEDFIKREEKSGCPQHQQNSPKNTGEGNDSLKEHQDSPVYALKEEPDDPADHYLFY